ncbi:sterol desaturase family protein [Sphingomonas paeninsulae]|uniref:Sterol desaturase family protein n=1 Tax=Sphingomonas paeninsulae TaxID=2319844 RepID=A0A494TFA5_SPHPE|nr:sterol desaturase family protein [Sphingomonas paeninsulae]AYJ85683.1 sterol desaturase family protein [Sphingomonas paeninsulae]
MNIADIIDMATLFASNLVHRALGTLLAPASHFSLLSLLSALLIAAAFLIARRPAHRPVPLRVLMRALIPRRWFFTPSARADFGMMALNLFVTSALVGWAICSAATVEHLLSTQLDSLFGTARLITAPAIVGSIFMTVAIYLAYEFAYFSNHYLSHHVPLFWQFHRTHHTAETLSPITNFRVHPVDTVLYLNTVGLFLGATSAIVRHVFGIAATQFEIVGTNVLLLSILYLLTHLQHSHMWIAFTGRLGRVILSPAHHQIHHSSDPKHYNRNFGNTLALFDWIVGTLAIPSKKRELLIFGAGPLPYDPHTVTGTLIMPFVDAAKLTERSPVSDDYGVAQRNAPA